MHDSRAQTSTPPVDARIAALAQRQHGVVSLRQLHALGAERGAIAHRLATGRLHRIHRGTYAVGHPILSLKAQFMAAALAAGDDSVDLELEWYDVSELPQLLA
jgi:predicted transcriptional regulator of viral defense system